MASVRDKILLLLLGGLALGFSYTPGRQWNVIKEVSKEWKKIKKSDLRSNISNLSRLNFINKIKNPDGSYAINLTKKGKLRALTYYFQNMKIENRNWDGKWRLVIFDIPEGLRRGRNALRSKIKKLGFYELQKSVFIFPYKCKDEIDFIVKFFGLSKYVHYGVLENIDNNAQLRKLFGFKRS